MILPQGAGLKKENFGEYYHKARESKAAQTLTTLSKTFISLTQKKEEILTKHKKSSFRETGIGTWWRVHCV